MSHLVPSLVCKLTHAHDAWIVGSAANPETDLKTVRDFDVIVPFSSWAAAAMLIPPDAKTNSFGGWKCQSEGIEVDVWPGDLAGVLVNSSSKWAWHFRSGVRVCVHSCTRKT